MGLICILIYLHNFSSDLQTQRRKNTEQCNKVFKQSHLTQVCQDLFSKCSYSLKLISLKSESKSTQKSHISVTFHKLCKLFKSCLTFLTLNNRKTYSSKLNQNFKQLSFKRSILNFQVPQPIGWGTSTNGLCVNDRFGAL